MHIKLHDALKKARGESQYVVVVFADIRGFSQFSEAHDSVEVATYVSKVYLRLIETFAEVTERAFFKSTGDGLLMVFPFEEAQFETIFQSLIRNCLDVHDSFKGLLANARVINFETPAAIGFGITRGAACALVSDNAGEDFVIDYSGHRLNLAARLQDLARPSGVVIEGSKDVELLDDETRKRFKSASVYVRSVAQTTPIKIWHLDNVQLQPINLRPMEAKWEKEARDWTLAELAKTADRYHLYLGPNVVPESVLIKLYRDVNPDTEIGGRRWVKLNPEKDYAFATEADQAKIILLVRRIEENHEQFLAACPSRGKLHIDVTFQRH
jgi:class 3 adenylate cyclase